LKNWKNNKTTYPCAFFAHEFLWRHHLSSRWSIESEILPANIPDDNDDAPDVGLSTEVIANDHNPLQEESDLPLDDPRPSKVFYDGGGWMSHDYFNHFENDIPDSSYTEG
jgi:hypothetical protein